MLLTCYRLKSALHLGFFNLMSTKTNDGFLSDLFLLKNKTKKSYCFGVSDIILLQSDSKGLLK